MGFLVYGGRVEAGVEICFVAFEGGQDDVVADGVVLVGFKDGEEKRKDV